MSAEKCRTCNDRPAETEHAGNCSDCAGYGNWFRSISFKSPEEVTGKVSPADLVERIDRGDQVRLELFASETNRPSGRLARLAKPEIRPHVVQAVPDDQGVSFTVRDSRGNTWSLWRPYRMGASLVLDGVPAELDVPNDKNE